MLKRLQSRWNVQSTRQVLVILLVFACTGFSVLFVKRPLYWLLGIPEAEFWWQRLLIFLLVTLPIYQALLLAWGWVFGQFAFFWAFEKRTAQRIASLFAKKRH